MSSHAAVIRSLRAEAARRVLSLLKERPCAWIPYCEDTRVSGVGLGKIRVCAGSGELRVDGMIVELGWWQERPLRRAASRIYELHQAERARKTLERILYEITEASIQ